MLTFDNIHPDLRVVGELLDQGHDLLWRRRAHLYMVVPLTWTIPSGFSDRVMPAGYLDVTDGTLVRLPSEFRIRRGKLVREDRNKAMQHINWFCHRVQEEFRKELYNKGIILLCVTKDVDPEIRMTPPRLFPEVEIRILVPKSLPHRLPNPEEQQNTLTSRAWRQLGAGFTYKTAYYPNEPEHLDDYDEFPCLDISGHKILSSNHGPYLLFNTFEPLRQAVSDIWREM